MLRSGIGPLLPLVFGAAAFAQDPNFNQPAYPMGDDWAVGDWRGEHWMDLDRDGRSDYVALAETQVRTLLGTGSARFLPGEILPIVAAEVHASAVGDWDGDGIDDLLIETLPAPGSGLLFERMLGDGAGHLVPAPPLPGPQDGTYAMEMLDIDGDGDLDLLGVAAAGLRVVQNDGVGGTGAHVTYSAGGTGGFGLVSGDFDLDGDVDAAVEVIDPGHSVRIMVNDGSGAFTLGGSLVVVGSHAWGIRAFDLGDDGDLDLMWKDISIGQGFLLSENPGTGAFPQPITIPAAIDTHAFATGDFDGDDLTDLFVYGRHASQVFFGTAGGGLNPGPAFDMPARELTERRTVLADDLNGDLRLDVVVGPAGVATVIENEGDGTFSIPATSHLPDGLKHLLDASDRDGDGVGDLLLYGEVGSAPKASIELGDGALGFVPGSSVALSFDGEPVAADVDLDGFVDVVVAEKSSGSPAKGLNVALTDGAGGFKGVTTLPLSVPVERLGVGRVDADPFPDVVLVSGAALGSVELRVAYGDGAGGLTLGSSVLTLPYSPGDVFVVNANGDAFGDLYYFDKGNKRVRVMHGDGAGAFAFVHSVIFSEASTSDVAPLRIDGDSLDDLIVFTDLERRVYLANGAGGLSLQSSSSVDACQFERPFLADLDGDGDEDLVASSQQCGVFAWWERTGPVDFAPVPRLHEPSGIDYYPILHVRAHAGDFDGDGLLELVSVYGENLDTLGVRILTRDCRGGAGRYGYGCAGSGGFVPRLGVVGCAESGRSVTLEVDRALGGSLAVLFLGLGEGAVEFAPGCELLVGTVLPVQLVLPLSAGGAGEGEFAAPAALPASQPDVTITLQAFVVDAGAGPGGLAATAGLELEILQ